jgi:hypothetical protein
MTQQAMASGPMAYSSRPGAGGAFAAASQSRRAILGAAATLGAALTLPVPASAQTASLLPGTAGATPAIAARIAALLDQQWDHLQWVAHSVQEFWPPQDVEELRFILETAHNNAPHIIWIGVATVQDGRVLAAVRGLIEGADVSQRPWFEIGTRRDGAVDVHDAVLLQHALRRDPSLGMLRLVDFVSPIRDASGAIVAMIGSHILWDWVVGLIQREQAMARARIALVSASGEVLLAPAGVPEAQILATPLLPVVQRADTPSFGWRIAVLRDG